MKRISISQVVESMDTSLQKRNLRNCKRRPHDSKQQSASDSEDKLTKKMKKDCLAGLRVPIVKLHRLSSLEPEYFKLLVWMDTERSSETDHDPISQSTITLAAADLADEPNISNLTGGLPEEIYEIPFAFSNIDNFDSEEMEVDPLSADPLQIDSEDNQNSVRYAGPGLGYHSDSNHCKEETESISLEAPQCQICRKIFANEHYLKIHVGMTHSNPSRPKTTHVCTFCQKRFTRSQNLRLHLKNKHTHEETTTSGPEAQIFPCTFCQKEFRREENLRIHMKNKHSNPEQPWTCTHCGKGFTQKFSRKRHEDNFCSTKKWNDSLANQSTTTANPTVTVPEAQIFPCSLCQKEYGSKQYLEMHERDHSGIPPFYCSFCHAPFFSTRTTTRDAHEPTCKQNPKYIEAALQTKVNPFVRPRPPSPVPVVQIKTKSPVPVLQKTKTESGIEPGSQKNPLEIPVSQLVEIPLYYIRVVGEGKAGVSEMTTSAFNPNTGQLVTCPPTNKKVQTTTTTTPTNIVYECEFCQMKFSLEVALKEHFFVHTTPKTFSCKICLGSFVTAEYLKNHSTLHAPLGLRERFRCRHCQRGFTTDELLTIHETAHTGEDVLRCRFCPEGFPAYNSLVHHETTDHWEEYILRSRSMEKEINNPSQVTPPVPKFSKCSICAWTFPTEEMEKHVKSHDDVAKLPYPCEFCERRFRNGDCKKNHERIHTGEQPYSCGYCGKRFARRYSCRRHEEISCYTKKWNDRLSTNTSSSSDLVKDGGDNEDLINFVKVEYGDPSEYNQESELQINATFSLGESCDPLQ